MKLIQRLSGETSVKQSIICMVQQRGSADEGDVEQIDLIRNWSNPTPRRFRVSFQRCCGHLSSTRFSDHPVSILGGVHLAANPPRRATERRDFVDSAAIAEEEKTMFPPSGEKSGLALLAPLKVIRMGRLPGICST